VDWESRVVRLDPGSTKNRDGRTFPFTAELERTLHEHLVEHDRLKQDGRIIPRVFHRDGEPKGLPRRVRERLQSGRLSWSHPARFPTTDGPQS